MTRLAPLLVLLGCVSPNEDDWPRQYADAYCDFERRCLAAVYWDRWDDAEECLDDTQDDVEDIVDAFDDCDFDTDKADECLGRLRDSCRNAGEDLDDLWESCGEVFDCT